MATQNENASTFRIVAIVTAVLLLAAAAFVFLQSGGGSGSDAKGTPADWNQLRTQSSTLLAKGASIESVSAAAAGLTAAGGNGSAGTTVAGGAGGNGDSQKSVQSGGGGGGAGFIRINTQAGSATLSGTLSPDATTKCMTQGTLH